MQKTYRFCTFRAPRLVLRTTKSVRFLHPVSPKMPILREERGFYLILNKENVKNQLNIFIPQDIIYAQNVSNYGLAVYCVLKVINVSGVVKHCLSPFQIYYYLTGDVKPSRRSIDYLRVGIEELIQNGIIFSEGEYQKCYLLDCSNLWIDTDEEKYTIISFDEVTQIFKIENINNYLLLKYFVFLVGTISSSIEVWIDTVTSKKRVVGNLTLEYISEKSGISVRTVIGYNKLLEEIGLLYINRQSDFIIDKNNDIRQLSNVYGRARDKSYIDTFALNQQKYKKSYHYVSKSNVKVNDKRRLSQKYNQLVKGNGQNYSKEEVIEIYNYVILENQKYESLFEKTNYEEYRNKIRDLELFEQYDFVNMSS